MYKYTKVFFLLFALSFLMDSCSNEYQLSEMPQKKIPARQLTNQVEVALVLGGGAFHGMAHLGVIKVLEEAGIPIDLIVGTSSGSLVGALYADRPNIDSLVPLIQSTSVSDIFNVSLFGSSDGFVSGKRLQKFMIKNLSVENIEETKIPLVVVATDIENACVVAFKSGPIAPSVNASSAIPGIFEPVKMYGTTYIDGGILDNVPVDVALEYHPKYIIAVDIMKLKTKYKLASPTDIIKRSYSIMIHQLTQTQLQKADMLITPDLEGIPYIGSKDNEKMYQLGIEAAREALPEIIKALQQKGVEIPKKQLE